MDEPIKTIIDPINIENLGSLIMLSEYFKDNIYNVFFKLEIHSKENLPNKI